MHGQHITVRQQAPAFLVGAAHLRIGDRSEPRARLDPRVGDGIPDRCARVQSGPKHDAPILKHDRDRVTDDEVESRCRLVHHRPRVGVRIEDLAPGVVVCARVGVALDVGVLSANQEDAPILEHAAGEELALTTHRQRAGPRAVAVVPVAVRRETVPVGSAVGVAQRRPVGVVHEYGAVGEKEHGVGSDARRCVECNPGTCHLNHLLRSCRRRIARISWNC